MLSRTRRGKHRAQMFKSCVASLGRHQGVTGIRHHPARRRGRDPVGTAQRNQSASYRQLLALAATLRFEGRHRFKAKLTKQVATYCSHWRRSRAAPQHIGPRSLEMPWRYGSIGQWHWDFFDHFVWIPVAPHWEHASYRSRGWECR